MRFTLLYPTCCDPFLHIFAPPAVNIRTNVRSFYLQPFLVCRWSTICKILPNISPPHNSMFPGPRNLHRKHELDLFRQFLHSEAELIRITDWQTDVCSNGLHFVHLMQPNDTANDWFGQAFNASLEKQTSPASGPDQWCWSGVEGSGEY